MPPVVMAMPMPVAMMGSDNGAGGSSHGRPTPASDRTADDGTADGAASCGALRHDIRDGHGECQQQKN